MMRIPTVEIWISRMKIRIHQNLEFFILTLSFITPKCRFF